MPINAYTGLMGSGKSYECVSSVIVPAIKNGRRVVTNVDGIDSDAIRAYCQEKWGIEPDKLGHVVHCKNDDVHKADFLPFGGNLDTFCQPGDIICIDEAWRFWGTDCKLLAEHKVFFREHRHFVDPTTKVCCDLVLMVQDIGDLHRTLKVVVELTFKTTKIKTLGWDKTYRVEMWEGYKLTIKGRVAVQNKRYDPAIFPLYSSYQGGTGKEMRVDDRQNVLKNPKLWIVSAVVICLWGGGLWYAFRFFSGSKYKTEQDASTKPTSSTATTTPTCISPASLPTAAHANAEVSASWRIVGTMQRGSDFVVIVANEAGALRMEHPSAFMGKGMQMVGEVDGQRITLWSGAPLTSCGKGLAK